MTQALLVDLPVEKDYPIAHLLRIFDIKLKDTKKGSKYLSFSVGDKSKNLPHCKKWDSSEEEFARIQKQKILFVTGKTDVWNDTLSILAESLAAPADDVTPEIYNSLVLSTRYKLNTLKKGVWDFIIKMEDDNIRQLCKIFLSDDLIKSRLSTWPAAVKNHHPYRGGLLTHIYRLMVHADAFVDTINENMYPGSTLKVNKDLVILGCLLHDLYKVIEYNEDGSYAPLGEITPHLPMAAVEANRKMDTIPDFPDVLRTAITHLCLSHHGQYGPTQPKTVEAIILHHIDYMFSRLDPALEELDLMIASKKGQMFSQDKVPSCKGKIWIGGTTFSKAQSIS